MKKTSETKEFNENQITLSSSIMYKQEPHLLYHHRLKDKKFNKMTKWQKKKCILTKLVIRNIPLIGFETTKFDLLIWEINSEVYDNFCKIQGIH